MSNEISNILAIWRYIQVKRKNQYKSWTFFVMSSPHQPVRKLKISKFFLYFLFSSIISSLIILSLAYHYTREYTLQLEKENRTLVKDLQRSQSIVNNLRKEQSILQSHANEVQEKLNQLKQLEVKLREISSSLKPGSAFQTFSTKDAMGGIEVKKEKSENVNDYTIEEANDQYNNLTSVVDQYASLTNELPNIIKQFQETIVDLAHLQVELKYTPTLWPTNVFRVTSTFGERKDPFSRRTTFHTGIDIAGPWGSPIYATADGVVKLAKWDGGYGYSILIQHSDELQTRYGHLYRFNVRKGDRVKKGDIIGFMGTSGRSTGVHLHYEVIQNGEYINPDPYLTFTFK
jgi:murein DD-endopeptidase MepM/ murein hydrolase activator NlpD